MPSTPGERLSAGRTAEIFSWDGHQILKLFRTWVTGEAIEREHRISRAVRAAGLPAPAVGEIVTLGDRRGIEYEKITGRVLSSALRGAPWRVRYYADLFAEIQVEIHRSAAPSGVPSQRQTLERRIAMAAGIDESAKATIVGRLPAIPDTAHLCHGDFHPENIILGPNGPVVIDWTDATAGNPLYDVARTTILLDGYLASRSGANRLEAGFAVRFWRRYLSSYFRATRSDREEYDRWISAAAAVRLTEGIPELQEWLIARLSLS